MEQILPNPYDITALPDYPYALSAADWMLLALAVAIVAAFYRWQRQRSLRRPKGLRVEKMAKRELDALEASDAQAAERLSLILRRTAEAKEPSILFSAMSSAELQKFSTSHPNSPVTPLIRLALETEDLKYSESSPQKDISALLLTAKKILKC